MAEQMKNANEYRENGKLFVKKIKQCICVRRDGDSYSLECLINQRGRRAYTYLKGSGMISGRFSGKTLWLSPEAKITVNNEVDAFDALSDIAGENEFHEICLKSASLSVFYRRAEGKYDFLLRFKNAKTDKTTTEIMRDTDIKGFLRRLKFCGEIADFNAKRLLLNPPGADISEHPFVAEARKRNDLMLENEVKLYFHLETPEDCEALSQMLGIKILPVLPVEFDREYVIDSGTVTEQSLKVLRRSGYEICHQPYFAMRGLTHEKYAVNPYKKYAVDAAGADALAISFDDFLKLFENFTGSGRR